MVMAPPHLAQWIRPVSIVGPLMTAEEMTFGLRAFKSACTVSNVSRSVSGGQTMIATSFSGFFSRSLSIPAKSWT